MTMTNYGNKYKFNAIMKRRSSKKDEVMVQRMKKNGEWGKALPTTRYGHETDEEVVARLIELNNRPFRLAE